jgi:hypothetical protein
LSEKCGQSARTFFVVTAAAVASLLFMVGLNRAWPLEKRRNYKDLVGWEFSILGTTHAAIFGFLLYAVWTCYGQADLTHCE